MGILIYSYPKNMPTWSESIPNKAKVLNCCKKFKEGFALTDSKKFFKKFFRKAIKGTRQKKGEKKHGLNWLKKA